LGVLMQQEPPQRLPWVLLGLASLGALAAVTLASGLSVPTGGEQPEPVEAPPPLDPARPARRARPPIELDLHIPAHEPVQLWVLDSSCSMNVARARESLRMAIDALDDQLPSGRRVFLITSTPPHELFAMWVALDDERPPVQYALDRARFRGSTAMAWGLEAAYAQRLPEGSEVVWLGDRNWMGRMRQEPDPEVAGAMWRQRGVRTSVVLFGPPGGPPVDELEPLVVAGNGRLGVVGGRGEVAWRVPLPPADAEASK